MIAVIKNNYKTKKEIIIDMLCSIFGNNVKNIIEENYNNEQELIKLAIHMLIGYMGKDNTIKILLKDGIIKKEDINNFNFE
ncbi:MAG: hypothetical protein QXM96_00780 [Candidatus Woesearchaeota archaeon]